MYCYDCNAKSKDINLYQHKSGKMLCENCIRSDQYFVCPSCDVILDEEDDAGTGFCREHSN